MYIFQQMDKAAKNISFASQQEARQWFRNRAMSMNPEELNPEEILQSSRNKNTGPFSIGKMYMFIYDAKHKDTLPFFDMFPLVFPIEPRKDGFLGLNLHYLPPAARAKLMDALYTTANNDKYNFSTKLQIDYYIMKDAARKYAGFQNCVKHYLFGQMKSRLTYVSPKDWDKALLLPMQQWKINPDRRYSSKASPPY